MSKGSRLYAMAAVVILLLGGIALGFLCFRYLLPLILPFGVAWLLSLLVRPLVDRVAGQRPWLRGVCAALLVLLLTGLLLLGLIKGCARGMSELGRLLRSLSETYPEGGLFSELSGWLTSVSARLPFPEGLRTHAYFEAFCHFLDAAVRESAASLLKTLGEQLPRAIMSMVGQLPSALLFVTSLLLSCYDFSADPQGVGERLGRALPPPWGDGVRVWCRRIKRAVTGYLRAYLLLGLITFLEMLVGLRVLGMPYALLMAGVIALVDLLPLLGAGAVLIPWGLVTLASGDTSVAAGLLGIFGIHTLLRQIWEPRLVGRELGLSPLTSLLAVYVGWRLFGVWGMLLSPLLAMVIKEGLGGSSSETEQKNLGKCDKKAKIP